MTEKILATITLLFISRYMAVIVHELGHYLLARSGGITVRIFSIGSGLRLITFKKFGTLWEFNLIPDGGYINIKCPPSIDDGNECEITDFLQFFPENKLLGMIAAGPLFSFFFGTLSLIFVSYGCEALSVISWILIGDFIISAYPYKGSDGYQVLKLVKHRKDSQQSS